MDLEYFKKILIERKVRISENIEIAKSELEDLKNVDINDEGDYAAICADNMIDSAIHKQQLKELEEIEEALKKIETGEYGICEMCGENIKPLRLKVKPYAKYCIICREIIEQENSRR
jgi:DnaK suppressor protein